MSKVLHRIWMDFNQGKIDGFMTLQRITISGSGKTTVEPLFRRVPIRSGQRGFEKTAWVRGKSPIPPGCHWMSTKPKPLQMTPMGTRFFLIATHPGERTIINPLDASVVRWDIGWHRENERYGSAGCTVTPDEDKFDAMADYIERLFYAGEPYVEVRVLRPSLA